MPTPTFPRPAPAESPTAFGFTARVLPFEAPLPKSGPAGTTDGAAPFADQLGLQVARESDSDCPVPRPRPRECAAVATQNATLVLDEGGHVRWCSPAARQVFGYGSERLLGAPIRALLPQLPLQAQTTGYNSAFIAFWFPGETARPLWGLDGDGQRFAVDVSVGVVRAERPCYVVALRRHCEPESTANDLRRFIEAVEQRADALAITEPDGTIVDANRAFEALTGYPRADVRGRRIGFLAVDGIGAERFARDRLHAGPESRATFLAAGRGERRFHVEQTARPFVDAQGHVTHYVHTLRDVSEPVAAAERLAHLAHHDSLTGLPNRALFADRLRQEIARSARDGAGFALLCLDLDSFKSINDRFGHEAGDEMLRILAQRLRRALREQDTVARLGGDEFAIILPRAASRTDVGAVLDGLRGALAPEAVIEGAALRFAASIGVARFPHDGADERSLLRSADQAMYWAKRAGTDRHCFADDRRESESAVAAAS